MIKNVIIIFMVSLFSDSIFAQPDQKAIASTLEKNRNFERMDSISRVLNLKGGDQVKVLATFSVNREGYIVDIKARGTHPFFEQEAIRVISELPQMDPLKPGAEIQRYSMPLVFVIETEREKRRRLKKEKKTGN